MAIYKNEKIWIMEKEKGELFATCYY